MKTCWIILAVLLWTGGCAGTGAPPAPTPVDAGQSMPEAEPAVVAWIARHGFCEPETVLPLPDRTLLVSNVCGFRQAGTGYLSLLAADGEMLNGRIVDALDAPTGMALHGSTLYVVDANALRLFRWPGFRPLQRVALDTQVANDIAVATDGTMYVTDTARGDVLIRGPDGTTARLGSRGAFPGANGIAIDGDALYVGGKQLWRVHLATGGIDAFGPPWLTDVDGIEFEADGTLQITPVGGPLVRLRTDGKAQVLGGSGISSANHGYAPALGLALVPTGFDNTVVAIRVVQPAD